MAKKKPKKIEKKKLSDELKGFFLLLGALIACVSLLSFMLQQDSQNWVGLIGYSIGWVLYGFFGVSCWIPILFLGWLGWRKLFNKPINRLYRKTLYVSVMTVSLSMLACVIEDSGPGFHLGGSFFYFLYKDLPQYNMSRLINAFGITLLFGAAFVTSFILLFKISFKKPEFKRKETEPVVPDDLRFVKVRIPKQKPADEPEMLAIQPEKELKIRPSLSSKTKIEEAAPLPPTTKKEIPTSLPEGNFTTYECPSVNLLTLPKKVDSSLIKKDLKRQAEVLEETLSSFGIEAKVGQINCGPTITSFEVHPSIGVKVQKIKTLENDIALNMEAKSIRIIAPIPGKAAVGIEVPNSQPQEVSFREMLQAYQTGTNRFKIPILLGKAVNGDYVMSDLAKMPHCIIAGATGSGKSVCINTIVMSIVMNAKPDQIKLVMVDPKKVELTPYTRLPHMLAPVITEPKEACLALNWLVKEMEKRYEILKLLGVRNIEGFNNRQVNEELEKTLEIEIPRHMPYLVGIIDELADLMMVSASDIETPIARIAQMARAVGIHLILATQRPSREVITGLIKANFPTRISFKVASRVNSQIVLDEVGAESLLGNGDMLFLPPGTSHLIRAQGAFIRDDDILKVIKRCEEQAPPHYVISSFTDLPGQADEDDDLEEDELYSQAKEIILSTGNASTTFLQRKLKVGYARAASLIDQLESRGIVGPQEGAKPRKILQARPKMDAPELAPIEEMAD